MGPRANLHWRSAGTIRTCRCCTHEETQKTAADGGGRGVWCDKIGERVILIANALTSALGYGADKRRKWRSVSKLETVRKNGLTERDVRSRESNFPRKILPEFYTCCEPCIRWHAFLVSPPHDLPSSTSCTVCGDELTRGGVVLRVCTFCVPILL